MWETKLARGSQGDEQSSRLGTDRARGYTTMKAADLSGKGREPVRGAGGGGKEGGRG